MRGRIRLNPVECLVLAMFLCTPALAAEPASSAGAAPETIATPRFTLKASSTESAAQQSGRYSLRARFAPAESAGELREGGGLALIGRFAKAGVSCDSNTLFSNGFEGN